MRGVKNSEMKKQNAVDSAVSPVRPPSLMPAADSRQTVSGAQPRREPAKRCVLGSRRCAAEGEGRSGRGGC
jgi:hypothetical protein